MIRIRNNQDWVALSITANTTLQVAQRNYSILSHEKEIHNLSGSLKLFFRELKEPLIPYDLYQDFIQATGSGKD